MLGSHCHHHMYVARHGGGINEGKVGETALLGAARLTDDFVHAEVKAHVYRELHVHFTHQSTGLSRQATIATPGHQAARLNWPLHRETHNFYLHKDATAGLEKPS